MPELPEVEVTAAALRAVGQGRRISAAVIRVPKLRWDIAPHLAATLAGADLVSVARRGKYLLLRCEQPANKRLAGAANGWLLIHLGMSGSLTVVPAGVPPRKHDHMDLQFGARTLRLHDPRRFGALIWVAGDDAGSVDAHPLIARLGVEPFSEAFNGELLWQGMRGRTVSIKQALLAGDVVVGVGNIYCSEALFRAAIRPAMKAGKLSRQRAARLVDAIRSTLGDAIKAGGSTLRDFVSGAQQTGYFQIQAFVYDRAGEPCRICGATIRRIVQGQRATYWCPNCQKP
jgi:formamidopyrimidine-DNA glycosylase